MLIVSFLQEYSRIFLAMIVFGFFHSIAAHERFKEALGRILTPFFVTHFWRLLYCIMSYLLFYMFFAAGFFYVDRSNSVILWSLPEGVHLAFSVLRILGVLILYVAFLQMDYFSFLGISQFLKGIRALFKRSSKTEKIKILGVDALNDTGIYGLVRHPMNLGGVLVTIPIGISKNNLVYFGLVALYTAIGSIYEEKRLIRNMGESYREYQRNVGAYFPRLGFFKKQIEVESAN